MGNKILNLCYTFFYELPYYVKNDIIEIVAKFFYLTPAIAIVLTKRWILKGDTL